MLSPSFSSFFPLKRQNMPIFFQAVVFSLNCKRRFYISQFKIFFLFFYASSPLDLPRSSFCIKHLLQNSSEPRFSPRSPPQIFCIAIFYLSTPNSRRFLFITRFFIEAHARKTLFCRSFSFTSPVKRTQKGRPVLGPAALASGVRFLENYISLMAACAAARRAIGTRKGEQET